jgi:hypothetical protein
MSKTVESKKEVAKILNTTTAKIKTLSKWSWGVYQFEFDGNCYTYFTDSKNLRKC